MIDILLKEIENEESLILLYEHQLKQVIDTSFTEYNLQYHKDKLEKLNELIRFSDPVTGEATKDIEDSIKEMLADLKTSVIKDDANNIKLLIKKITNAVKDRNRICKANKV